MVQTSALHNSTWSVLRLLALVVSCGLGLWFALALFGLVPPIHVKQPNLGDPALLWLLPEHALIGVVLFLGILTSGVTLLLVVANTWKLTALDLALLGLPIGTLYWLAACALVRLCGLPDWVAFALGYGLPLIRLPQLRNWFRDLQENAAPGRNRMVGAILIIAFGLVASFQTGLMWRFPNEFTFGTVDLGDIGHYTASYHALRVSFFPFVSLGMEGEQFANYINLAAPILAFGFDFIPGFEISFFLTSTIILFFFLSTCWCACHIISYRHRIGLRPLTGLEKSAIILMLAAATRYPSWFAETTPYAFAVPFAIALAYLAARGKERPVFLFALAPLTLIFFAISKIVVFAVLGAYSLALILGYVLRHRSGPRLAVFAGLSALLAVFAILLIGYYGPRFAAIASLSDFGPPSFQILYRKIAVNGTSVFKALFRTLPTLAMDLSGLLLIWGAWRLRNYALLLALISGVSLYLFYSFLFNGTLAIAPVLIAACIVLGTDSVKHQDRGRWIFISAAVFMMISHVSRDPAGPEFAIIWMLCLGGALAVVFALHAPEEHRPATRFGDTWRYAVPVALLLAVLGQAEGRIRFADSDRQIVSTNLYQLWLNVRQLTPPDALIFTDQTGNNPTRLEGWNDLSLTAERQFYISSWSVSPLRTHEAARQERLNMNSAVLRGTTSPQQLPLSKPYGSYFAAVGKAYVAPKDFVQIYSNADYTLYRIPAPGQQ